MLWTNTTANKEEMNWVILINFLKKFLKIPKIIAAFPFPNIHYCCTKFLPYALPLSLGNF